MYGGAWWCQTVMGTDWIDTFKVKVTARAQQTTEEVGTELGIVVHDAQWCLTVML